MFIYPFSNKNQDLSSTAVPLGSEGQYDRASFLLLFKGLAAAWASPLATKLFPNVLPPRHLSLQNFGEKQPMGK